jgi:hypothetical protein
MECYHKHCRADQPWIRFSDPVKAVFIVVTGIGLWKLFGVCLYNQTVRASEKHLPRTCPAASVVGL